MGDAFATIATLGLNKVFSSPKPAAPPAAPALPGAPKKTNADSAAAKAARAKKASATDTVYTSPLGIPGQAQVVRKTLTGQ